MVERGDYAIILARGASSRMGRPKGLLPCPGKTNVTFLQSIASVYQGLEIPVLVVTTVDLVKTYEQNLTGEFSGQVIGCPAGGETGQTLKYGWQTVDGQATHLWAHPVDLPLVATETLGQLKSHSLAHPQRLLRPGYAGDPGHPVVIPVAGLDSPLAAELWQQAPMREVIAVAQKLGHIEQSMIVPVNDPGVVMDFDSPADLEHFGDAAPGKGHDDSA